MNATTTSLQRAYDELVRELGDGWRKGQHESYALFHTNPDGTWVKVRVSTCGYEAEVLVSRSWMSRAIPVRTEKLRTAAEAAVLAREWSK